MTTIDTETDVTTLINVLTVAPERQDELVDLLADAGHHPYDVAFTDAVEP